MNRLRVVAAIAAMLTVLLLQATVVGPVSLPVPVSLPAVLVAAVALTDGPGTGMALGFATGLIADLGSTHPAGVLALCWLGLGLVCGLAAEQRSVRRDAALAAVACAIAALIAALILELLHAGASGVGSALVQLIPSGLGDALLALAVVPVVRTFLRSGTLRAPQPVPGELTPAGERG